MKIIKVNKFGVDNYCQFVEPLEYSFEEGITIITGANGAGKTNFMDSIGFTWFGITSKGDRGPDVVNKKVAKNCHTWTDIEIDNIPYEIHRYYEDEKYGNSVEIYQEGELIESKTSESERLLEKLILPKKLFFNILSFSQKVKAFFTTLPPGQQRDIFREIFMLDQYTLWYKESDIALKEIDSKIKDIQAGINITKNLLEREKNLLIEIIDDRSKFLENKEKQLTKIQYDICNTNHSINCVSNFVVFSKEKDSKQLLDETRSKLLDLQKEFQNSLNERKEVEEKTKLEFKPVLDSLQSNFDLDIQELDSKKQNYESTLKLDFNDNDNVINNSISEKQHNISLNKEKIESNNKLMVILSKECSKYKLALSKDKCPTCERSIDTETKKTLLTNCENKNNDFKKYEQDNVNLYENISKFEKDLQLLFKEKSELQKKYLDNVDKLKSKYIQSITKLKQDFNNDKDSILKELQHRIESKLEIISNKIEEGREIYNNLENQIKTVIEPLVKEEEENQILLSNYISELSFLRSSLRRETNNYFSEDRLLNCKVKIEELNKKIEDYENQLQKVNKELDILVNVKAAFSPSGIPNYLISSGVPFMNKRCSELLDLLSESRYSIVFDTLSQTKSGEFRDKPNLVCMDSRNMTTSRKQLSGGQERLVDICILIALHDLQSIVHNVKFNFMLFDEIFDSLDDENTSSVSNLLLKLSNDGTSINIISHTHVDSINATRYIHF